MTGEANDNCSLLLPPHLGQRDCLKQLSYESKVTGSISSKMGIAWGQNIAPELNNGYRQNTVS